ncbi:hypothetical protein HY989_04160 [Candidatus Micrarchaeota archaeon]|nr:hypothetical protein [Candidatus Micrarchaeota archaeon]
MPKYVKTPLQEDREEIRIKYNKLPDEWLNTVQQISNKRFIRKMGPYIAGGAIGSSAALTLNALPFALTFGVSIPFAIKTLKKSKKAAYEVRNLHNNNMTQLVSREIFAFNQSIEHLPEVMKWRNKIVRIIKTHPIAHLDDMTLIFRKATAKEEKILAAQNKRGYTFLRYHRLDLRPLVKTIKNKG